MIFELFCLFVFAQMVVFALAFIYVIIMRLLEKENNNNNTHNNEK